MPDELLERNLRSISAAQRIYDGQVAALRGEVLALRNEVATLRGLLREVEIIQVKALQERARGGTSQ